MPIYRCRFSSNQQFLTVGRELITVEVLEVTFACSAYIENHFYFLACFERVFNDLRAVGVHLRVVFAIRHGDYSLDIFRAETSGGDIF